MDIVALYKQLSTTDMLVYGSIFFAVCIQLGGYLFFFLSLLQSKKRYRNSKTTTRQEPVSVIYYIEHWSDEYSGKHIRDILRKSNTQSEIIVLLNEQTAYDAKFFLDKLATKYQGRLLQDVMNNKTRGMSRTQFALLTGVRKARNNYITFVRAHHEVSSLRFHTVSKKLRQRKERILFAYANIRKKATLANVMYRILNFHTQMLSFLLLSRGVCFIPLPRNIFFPKKYYLRGIQMTSKASVSSLPIFQHFEHIGKLPFKAIMYVDAVHRQEELLPVTFSSFIQTSVDIIRNLEQRPYVFFLLSLHALTNAVMLIGSIWLALFYSLDYPIVAALLMGIGARHILYWFTLIGFWITTEKSWAGLFILPLFELFFGIIATVAGFFIWILKPFKQ